MLRIGITGHRVLTRVEKIEEGIREVLSQLKISFSTDNVIVFSSLAQGADCLFVKQIIKTFQSKLVVVLPVPVSNYLEDFNTSSDQATFLELYNKADKIVEPNKYRTRESAYLAAGEYIVKNCDILAAIWDGQGAHGTGGTGEIVNLARSKNLPLVWIRAGNRYHGTLDPTDMGESQGEIIYERFPDF